MTGFRSVVICVTSVCSMALAACASDQRRPSLQPATSTPPTTASPSPEEVKAAIRSGLGSLRSFRAEMVVRHHGQERRRTLEMTAEGFIRETDFHFRERTTVYDSARGISHSGPSGEPPTSGHPPGRHPLAGPFGGPEPWTAQLLPGVIDDPVLFARHVLDWPDFPVTLTTANDRPAWGLQWSTPRGSNPDHVAVTIDRSTGLALRAEAFFENQVTYVLEVATLHVNTELPDTAPPASGSRSVDLGYRRTTVQEAAGLAGYKPVVPTWLPAGFIAAEVGYATQYRSSTAFLHPDSTDIVTAVYRRGLDVLTITTRRRGSRPWTNPFSAPPPPPEAPPSSEPPNRRVALIEWAPAVVSGGAFAGARAEHTTRAWYGNSHFWALNDELTLTAQGDVTVDEMQRIIESLRPV